MTDNLPPLQREREAFEAEFPLPSGVTWVGHRYKVSESYLDSYRCDRFVGQWAAWKARAAIDAALAARGAVPAGWVMVPKDPTLEMLKAGHAYGYPPNIWAAMINSAPVAAAPQQVAQAKPEQAAQPIKKAGGRDE